MQREYARLKQKMQQLHGDIDKMKTSKVTMARKLKEEGEKHRKW